MISLPPFWQVLTSRAWGSRVGTGGKARAGAQRAALSREGEAAARRLGSKRVHSAMVRHVVQVQGCGDLIAGLLGRALGRRLSATAGGRRADVGGRGPCRRRLGGLGSLGRGARVRHGTGLCAKWPLLYLFAAKVRNYQNQIKIVGQKFSCCASLAGPRNRFWQCPQKCTIAPGVARVEPAALDGTSEALLEAVASGISGPPSNVNCRGGGCKN